jgi:PRA1 family protein 1
MDMPATNGSAPIKPHDAGATTPASASNPLEAVRAFGSTLLHSAISSISSSQSVAPQVESVRAHATSVWASARPWTEFFHSKKFIPATSLGEVQQRLLDNLQHFSSNYILIFIGLSTLGVVVHPMSFVCLLACVGLYVFMFLQNPGSVRIGPLSLTVQTKRFAFGAAAFFILYLTNAVAILGSWALFSVILSLVHAGARVSVKEPDFESAVEV